jgi:hypothetical protein
MAAKHHKTTGKFNQMSKAAAKSLQWFTRPIGRREKKDALHYGEEFHLNLGPEGMTPRHM